MAVNSVTPHVAVPKPQLADKADAAHKESGVKSSLSETISATPDKAGAKPTLDASGKPIGNTVSTKA